MLSIKVPPLGESIVEATISQWRKKEGDTVAAGETLVDLETDKVTVEVPSLKSGILVRRLKQEGDVVAVNEELALLDDTVQGVVAPAATAPVVAPPSLSSTIATPPAPRPLTPSQPVRSSPAFGIPYVDEPQVGAPRVSPAAVRIAAEHGVDVGTVTGTGRGGVVSKPDVIEYLAAAGSSPAAAPHPPAAAPATTPGPATAAPLPPAATSANVRTAGVPRETREKMSTRRKRMAEHLLEAQHATAHLTTFNEIDMSAVDALRTRVREKIEKEHGVRLSFMPFFVKAACVALKQFPVANARIDADHFVYHHYVNMGIAVASDAGLVVPNLKDADAMGLIDIGRAIGDIAKKARDGKLTMDDLTGGTFTITNGGVFGSLLSTPIINFPQVGILGLHKMQDRPVVVGGQIVVRPMMYVALSYDHRVIDGQQAVLFLVKVKELMEDPALLAID